jgi:hypothetical protein
VSTALAADGKSMARHLIQTQSLVPFRGPADAHTSTLTERGSTMMQFALVIPLLMMLVLAIVDISRLFAVEAMLNKGAEEGLNLAMKIPNLDVDLRGRAPDDWDYINFSEARRRVLQAATRVPLATVAADYSDPAAPVKLVGFRYEDTLLNLGGSPPPQIERGAAFLRPGDRTYDLSLSSYKDYVKQEARADIAGNPPPQDTDTLLRYYPIQVDVCANVDLFFPGFGTKTVCGRALGYREPGIPRGPLPSTDPMAPVTSSTTTSTTTTTTYSTTTTTVLCNPTNALRLTGCPLSGRCIDPSTPGPGPCGCKAPGACGGSPSGQLLSGAD